MKEMLLRYLMMMMMIKDYFQFVTLPSIRDALVEVVMVNQITALSCWHCR